MAFDMRFNRPSDRSFYVTFDMRFGMTSEKR